MNHYEITELLRNAQRDLGKDVIRRLLPKPFLIWISDHDTGCQIGIKLSVENVQTVTAWEGSVWYSSCYEFNDRNRILGFNPETKDFCEAPLTKFFEDVQSAYADMKANAVATAEGKKIEEQASRENAVSLYRNLVRG